MRPIDYYKMTRVDSRVFTLEEQVDIHTIERWFYRAAEECR
jgi:hypothetical protein